MNNAVCNPNKKSGLLSRPSNCGEGFEPPTFGLLALVNFAASCFFNHFRHSCCRIFPVFPKVL